MAQAAVTSLEKVRALQSRDVELPKKVDIAWSALPMVQGAAQNAVVPGALIGHLHFVRYLFQWSLSTLIKAAEGPRLSKKRPVEAGGVHSEPGSNSETRPSAEIGRAENSAKRRKSGAQVKESVGGATFGSQSNVELKDEGGPSVQPLYGDLRLWEVLKACLLSDKLGGDALVSPALLQAVTSVLSTEALAFNQHTTSAAELDSSISDILTVLSTRFDRSFRPSLEQWAAVADVALKHPTLSSGASHPDSSSASDPFRQTILLIVRGLDATCRAHANPRKVFTLQVGRLLTPVLRARLNLQAGIAQAQCIGHDFLNKVSAVEIGNLGWMEQMLQALESLLEGGLFHGAHMAGYPDICSSLEDLGLSAEAAKDHAEGGEIGGERESPEAKNPKKKRKKKGEEGGEKEGGESAKTKLASYHRLLFQELEAGVNGHDPAVVGSLDWFLRAYTAASKREQRSSLNAKSSQEDDAPPPQSDVTPEDALSPKAAQPEAVKKKRLSESETTFRVFAELTRPLLQQLETGEGKEMLLGLVRGCRLLLAAANEVQAYIPTEDTPSRAHYHFLERLKTSVLNIPNLTQTLAPREETSTGLFTELEPAALPLTEATTSLYPQLAGQVLSFLAVLIETEYRVLDGDLVPVWSLLLRAAEIGAEGPARGVPGEGRTAPPDVGEWLAGKAVKLGSRLLEIYSDLRQVEHILTSLTDALHAHAGGGISRLVCSAPFLKALSRVVQKLPMGQAAPLVRMVARDQGALLEKIASGEEWASVAALTELHVSILDHIHVTEGNAVAIGTAARGILHSVVAPRLESKLQTWSQTKSDTQTATSGANGHVGTGEKGRRKPVGGGLEPAQEVGKAVEGVCDLEDGMLVRLFLSGRSLHEHAVGLMPPPAAKKARASLLSVEPSLSSALLSDQEPVVEELSIFGAIGCGQLRLGAVIVGLKPGLGASPALGYAVDCLVLQELERLSRLKKRLELGLRDVDSDTALAALRVETASLLQFLLPSTDSHLVGNPKHVGDIEPHASGQKRNKSEQKREATPVKSKQAATPVKSKQAAPTSFNGPGDVPGRSNGWDGVVSSLTEKSYGIARWSLVCQSVDLWAPLASPEQCMAVLRNVLGTIERNEGESKAVHPEFGAPVSKPIRIQVESQPDSSVGGIEASVRKQIACEMTEELNLNEPPRLLTAEASTLELLRDSAFYEQPAFQKQLPRLLLGELRALFSSAVADVRSRGPLPDVESALIDLMTSSKGGNPGGEGLKEGSLGHLGRCNALLRFLGQLAGGYMRSVDVGESITVLIRMERCMLLAAQSGVTTPSEQSALFSCTALCHTTIDGILASNSAALFPPPKPLLPLPSGTPTKPKATSPDALASLSVVPFNMSKHERQSAFPEAGQGRRLVEGLLSATQGCAQAGVNTPSHSAVPVISSTKGALHTLAVSALEATGFAPLQVGKQATGLVHHTEKTRMTGSEGPATESLCEQADDLLEAAVAAVLSQCEQASAFLSADSKARSSRAAAASSKTGPMSLLPRTLLLAAKQKGTRQGPVQQKVDSEGRAAETVGAEKRKNEETAKVSKERIEEEERKAKLIVGWAEAASAAANAGAFLEALEGVMEARDQACRAGRDVDMAWQARGATWQAVVGRLEGAVVECLSTLTGGQKGEPEKSLENGKGEQSGKKGEKGRRVLEGSLEGLETVLSGRADAEGCESPAVREGEGGADKEPLSAALSSELISGRSEVAALKRVLVGELFASAGSAIRIHCVLASPHVIKPPDLPPRADVGGERGTAESMDIQEASELQAEVKSEGSGRKAGKKKRKGVEENGASALKKRRADVETTSRDENGSEVKLEPGRYGPGDAAAACVKEHSQSPALANMGRHLAAASDVINSLLQHLEVGGSETDQMIGHSSQMLVQVVRFLEAAGRSLPLLTPAPPITAFDWLVETHLALLGASVALTSKALMGPGAHMGNSEGAFSAVRSATEESLGTLIKGASRQQLLRVLQGVEREMFEGEGEGRTEAAVGALAVVLESVSGPKSLRLLASHAPRLLPVLFSVIGSAAGQNQSGAATSASLLTSALHVLTTFVSRESLFPLTAGHVGLALSVPATLFSLNQALPRGSQPPPRSSNDTLQTETPSKMRSEGTLEVDSAHDSEGASSVRSADVAAGECAMLCASSRLLQAVLRHRPKEVRRCAALLVGSLQSMLQAVAAWSQQEGRERSTVTACAALRRVYEEVSNHKASLSHYCVHMLADYLAALCGLTASKDAISREAASTVRSGIFALFDSCSPYDLQQLHASLGADAMRRNALGALRQDYEKRHKYTGKV